MFRVDSFTLRFPWLFVTPLPRSPFYSMIAR